MNNIEKGSVKHLVLSIIIYAVMGVILYPIFDILYCKFITKTAFVYSFYQDVTKPIGMAFLMGICFWLVEKNKKGK